MHPLELVASFGLAPLFHLILPVPAINRALLSGLPWPFSWLRECAYQVFHGDETDLASCTELELALHQLVASLKGQLGFGELGLLLPNPLQLSPFARDREIRGGVPGRVWPGSRCCMRNHVPSIVHQLTSNFHPQFPSFPHISLHRHGRHPQHPPHPSMHSSMSLHFPSWPAILHEFPSQFPYIFPLLAESCLARPLIKSLYGVIWNRPSAASISSFHTCSINFASFLSSIFPFHSTHQFSMNVHPCSLNFLSIFHQLSLHFPPIPFPSIFRHQCPFISLFPAIFHEFPSQFPHIFHQIPVSTHVPSIWHPFCLAFFISFPLSLHFPANFVPFSSNISLHQLSTPCPSICRHQCPFISFLGPFSSNFP